MNKTGLDLTKHIKKEYLVKIPYSKNIERWEITPNIWENKVDAKGQPIRYTFPKEIIKQYEEFFFKLKQRRYTWRPFAKEVIKQYKDFLFKLKERRYTWMLVGKRLKLPKDIVKLIGTYIKEDYNGLCYTTGDHQKWLSFPEKFILNKHIRHECIKMTLIIIGPLLFTILLCVLLFLK